MSKTVEFSYEFPMFDQTGLWNKIGSFTDLDWTGDDPWMFSSDGKTRELPEHGMKETLVAQDEFAYTYAMVEGPFANFKVTIAAVPNGEVRDDGSGGGSKACYTATGDISDGECEMVMQGAQGAFDAFAAQFPP